MPAVPKHAGQAIPLLAAAALLAAGVVYARQQRTDAARVHATALVTDGKLNQIHTLVNSDMTAARQSELDQTRAMVVVLKRVNAAAKARGEKPTLADVAALERAEDRTEELEQILADRLAQFRLAEEQVAEAEHKATEADPA